MVCYPDKFWLHKIWSRHSWFTLFRSYSDNCWWVLVYIIYFLLVLSFNILFVRYSKNNNYKVLHFLGFSVGAIAFVAPLWQYIVLRLVLYHIGSDSDPLKHWFQQIYNPTLACKIYAKAFCKQMLMSASSSETIGQANQIMPPLELQKVSGYIKTADFHTKYIHPY